MQNTGSLGILQRLPADRKTLAELASWPAQRTPELLRMAGEARDAVSGARVSLEVLYNAKKGGCSEDCHFCSQSARYATGVEPEQLGAVDDFLAAARDAARRGAGEFCIVVAVRGPSARLLQRVVEATRRIKEELPLKVAVSLGILREAQVRALVDAGVDKVNHNLETSRRYFPSICTTHTFDERWDTCMLVKRYGLELCSGGIIGMGETQADRLDFLAALQELAPEEVPINFLNPRPGTPLGARPLLDPQEALRFIALARLALPHALIRLAGGREITLRGMQELGMTAGANGLILGNYLTTSGRADEEDFAMLERLGFVATG
jgi:biotin synthase